MSEASQSTVSRGPGLRFPITGLLPQQQSLSSYGLRKILTPTLRRKQSSSPTAEQMLQTKRRRVGSPMRMQRSEYDRYDEDDYTETMALTDGSSRDTQSNPGTPQSDNGQWNPSSPQFALIEETDTSMAWGGWEKQRSQSLLTMGVWTNEELLFGIEHRTSANHGRTSTTQQGSVTHGHSNANPQSLNRPGLPTLGRQAIHSAKQGADEPSTDQDSKSSGSQDQGEAQPSGSMLEQLVRRHFAEEVAVHFLRIVCGKLEYAPRRRIQSLNEVKGQSLLELLDVEVKGITLAPSDTSGETSSAGRSSTSGGSGSNLKSGQQNFGSDSSGMRQSANTGGQNDDSNGASSQADLISTEPASKAQRTRLRCHFHAFLPDIYCASKDVKYKSCQGPGFRSMQYLKEHFKNVHRKFEKRDSNSWLCNRCQETFQSQESLVDHELNVDCNIRCAVCHLVLRSKLERQTHSQQVHPRNDSLSNITEIDEELNSRWKAELKSYSDALKKGKGAEDAQRERWIIANTERYVNRQVGVNAALELGQWYITYQLLFPGVSHPSHPFYDQAMDALPGTEVAQEKFMFIWEASLDAHVQGNGLPPNTYEMSRAFYTNHTRTILSLASQTRLAQGSFGSLSNPSSFTDVITQGMPTGAGDMSSDQSYALPGLADMGSQLSLNLMAPGYSYPMINPVNLQGQNYGDSGASDVYCWVPPSRNYPYNGAQQ